MPYGSSGSLLPSYFNSRNYTLPLWGSLILSAASRNWGPFYDPASGLTNVTGIDMNWGLGDWQAFRNTTVYRTSASSHYISPPVGGNTNTFATGYSTDTSVFECYADIELYFGTTLVKSTTAFLGGGPIVITSGEWTPHIGEPISLKVQYYHFGWVTSCFDFHELQANEKTNDTSFPVITLSDYYSHVVPSSAGTIQSVFVIYNQTLGTVSTTDVLTQFNGGQSCYGTTTGSLNSLAVERLLIVVTIQFT